MSNTTILKNITTAFNATVVNKKPHYNVGEELGAIALVIILSAIGGLLLGALSGFKMPNFRPFNGY